MAQLTTGKINANESSYLYDLRNNLPVGTSSSFTQVGTPNVMNTTNVTPTPDAAMLSKTVSTVVPTATNISPALNSLSSSLESLNTPPPTTEIDKSGNALVPKTTGGSQSKLMASLKSMLGTTSNRADIQTELENEQNVAQLQEQKASAFNRYNKLRTAQQQQELSLEQLNTGGRQIGVERQLAKLRRDNAITLADARADAEFAAGNYKDATDLIDKKVKLIFEDQQQAIDNGFRYLEANRHDLTDSEARQIEQAYTEKNMQLKAKTDATTELSKVLAENQAPQSVKDAVSQAAANPNSTVDQIYAAAGSYGASILDRKIKESALETDRLQRANIYSQIAERNQNGSIMTDTSGKVVVKRPEAQKLNKELVSSDAYKAIQKGKDSLQFLQSFEDTFKKTGATSAVFSPRQNAELKAKYNAAILNLKEFFNLGVLNGPDEKILQGVLPDPTNRSAFATGASLGIYKPAASTKSGLDNMKQMIERSLDERFKNLSAQYGDYSNQSVTSLNDLGRTYLQQKLILHPEGFDIEVNGVKGRVNQDGSIETQ